MVELQHYEANAASGNVNVESLERPASAMPTNTRLQVAVLHTPEEVRDLRGLWNFAFTFSHRYGMQWQW